MRSVHMNNRFCEILNTGKRQVELPMPVITRMCYSYLNNDWLAFMSSGLKLIVALAMITIGHFNSDT